MPGRRFPTNERQAMSREFHTILDTLIEFADLKSQLNDEPNRLRWWAIRDRLVRARTLLTDLPIFGED